MKKIGKQASLKIILRLCFQKFIIIFFFFEFIFSLRSSVSHLLLKDSNFLLKGNAIIVLLIIIILNFLSYHEISKKTFILLTELIKRLNFENMREFEIGLEMFLNLL